MMKKTIVIEDEEVNKEILDQEENQGLEEELESKVSKDEWARMSRKETEGHLVLLVAVEMAIEGAIESPQIFHYRSSRGRLNLGTYQPGMATLTLPYPIFGKLNTWSG